MKTWMIPLLLALSAVAQAQPTVDQQLLSAQMTFRAADNKQLQALKLEQAAELAVKEAEQKLASAQQQLQQSQQQLQDAHVARQAADAELSQATQQLQQAWKLKEGGQ
ncbi:hypothetical protein [Vogesella sp. LIG4]|uniref:hypothetical protein n=1 Tax=Vogesella sp. LIG4 TaxID=1192162 RepID=UPI00081FF1C0|nr:hypothetical protein [Vogesella sp. LIG4]SCK14909.1 hypothetical protein PSELUDRAFT_1463 [Vogesella sp. LIG4]